MGGRAAGNDMVATKCVAVYVEHSRITIDRPICIQQRTIVTICSLPSPVGTLTVTEGQPGPIGVVTGAKDLESD